VFAKQLMVLRLYQPRTARVQRASLVQQIVVHSVARTTHSVYIVSRVLSCSAQRVKLGNMLQSEQLALIVRLVPLTTTATRPHRA
jgi:hypothetical protein